MRRRSPSSSLRPCCFKKPNFPLLQKSLCLSGWKQEIPLVSKTESWWLETPGERLLLKPKICSYTVDWLLPESMSSRSVDQWSISAIWPWATQQNQEKMVNDSSGRLPGENSRGPHLLTWSVISESLLLSISVSQTDLWRYCQGFSVLKPAALLCGHWQDCQGKPG